MTDIPTPMEMGFAEFTASLISEVFDAVANSQAEQEQRLAGITAAASLPLEDFAEKFITNDQVDGELARLFPSSEPKHLHAIYTNAPYTPKTFASFETPALESTLGVILERKDYRVNKGGRISLTNSAVKKTRLAARLRLAETRQITLRALVRQGIPRVIVDSGHVNAKLTFQVTRMEEANKPVYKSRLAAPLRDLVQMPGITLPPSLKQVRLLVRQVDDRAPQTSQMQVNIFGEVEITFKTIT